MICSVLMLLQLFTIGFAQPGSLISQALPSQNDINLVANILGANPSQVPNIVLPPPTVQPNPGPPVLPTPTAPIAPTPTAPIAPTPTAPIAPTPTAPIVPTPTAPIAPTPTVPSTPIQTPNLPPPVVSSLPIVGPIPQAVIVGPQPVIVRQQVVEKQPQAVRIATPVVSKKTGVSLVIVPDRKCTDLADILQNREELSILALAIDAADLQAPNQKENTLFAPTNQAFEKLANQLNTSLEQLLQSTDLSAILLYHFVPGKLLQVVDLKNKQVLETRLAEKKLTVDKPGKNNVNIVADASKAKITIGDIKACDLIIHIIDTVLVPQL